MSVYFPVWSKATIPAQLVQLFIYVGLFLYLMTFSLPAYADSEVVGHVSFARGSNAAQQPEGKLRILGKDSEIYQGDNIQTTERSFVIIIFKDGSEVTVRPNSSFSINRFDNHSHDKAVHLELFHGGISASTGDVAISAPQNFQIKTPMAVIQPVSEETEFAVDICDQKCEEKGKQNSVNQVRTEQSMVARVVDLRGEVSARDQSDSKAVERFLSLNSPLYNSDVVMTGNESYALLVFPDGEKITLQADTELDIIQYLYDIEETRDKVSLRLVTGGLRALTGAIGKRNPSAVTIETPVATIGIRGTGTDSYTDGASLNHSTWRGLSFLRNEAGEFDVPTGSSSYTAGSNVAPTIFITPPDVLEPHAPRPDTNEDDPEKVFAKKPPPVKGDVAVKTIRGELIIRSENEEKHITVKDGVVICP